MHLAMLNFSIHAWVKILAVHIHRICMSQLPTLRWAKLWGMENPGKFEGKQKTQCIFGLS